ncbi:hypothetical protein [Agarivorans sp. QJM3NY_33]|uniref:hypothetical protein n=1 Tax=Agarivorans sp. QJM3NY_33 TaxID=3421432 RepID=UPI003D7CF1CB
MQASSSAIEKMGYSKYPDDDVLLVKFSVQRVYSVQGINFEKESELLKSAVIQFGQQCKVVIADSVNKAANEACGEDYAENEEEWVKEKKGRSPYLLVCFEENEEHILKGGYRQEKEEHILTYDEFKDGKQEIKKWEVEELPSIITSLTVHLSEPDLQIKLVSLDRSVYGKTKDNKTLFDLKMTASMSAFQSRPKSTVDINLSLRKSTNLYSSLDQKTSRHIFMALEEPDRLKQFLYYFLFIERFTHSQFKKINYDNCAQNMFNIPARMSVAGMEFFKERQLDAKNLSQRFQWCSLLLWSEINDNDVTSFKKLKKTRDLISHGENVIESTLPVEEIRILALKLLGSI